MAETSEVRADRREAPSISNSTELAHGSLSFPGGACIVAESSEFRADRREAPGVDSSSKLARLESEINRPASRNKHSFSVFACLLNLGLYRVHEEV